MTDPRQLEAERSVRSFVEVVGAPAEATSIWTRMALHRVPGVSIAVVEDGAIAWSAGYGHTRAGGPPITPDTPFQVASISKVVNALLVLILAERGVIDLDAPVNRQLRTWQLSGRHRDRVTARQLLSHTAGTTVPGFPGYPTGTELPSVIELLDGAAPATNDAVTASAEPGRSRYSGGGTMVLQHLVSDVTGEPYAEVAHALVLQPLGMTASTYAQPPSADQGRLFAHGHDAAGIDAPAGWRVYPELAAAGLWSTVTDLAKLIAGLQAAIAGDRYALLTPAIAAAMATAVDGGVFGLGPQLAGAGSDRRMFHNGTNAGFCSHVEAYVHHRSGVAVLTNGDGGNQLILEVLAAIGDAHAWSGFERRRLLRIELSARWLDSLVGEYDGPPGERSVIMRDGAHLTSVTPSGPRRLIPVSPTTFVDERTGADIVFDISSLGATGASVRYRGETVFTITRST